MEPRSSLYQAINAQLQGSLAERLAALRGSGADRRSWEQVALRLYAEDGVQVSSETLRQWAETLGIEGEAA